MLTLERGNIFDLAETGKFDIVVHGCNCFNNMRKGIAKEVSVRYPEVAEADLSTELGDYRKLGNWTEGYAWYNLYKGDLPDSFIIVNAYTQYNVSKGEDAFEYNAFELILQKLAYMYPKKSFAFPYIGMGLAGGDKNIILPMIERFSVRIAEKGGSVTLVEFK